MRLYTALFFTFCTVKASFHEEELYGPYFSTTPQTPRPLQTRSLSGTKATDGNYAYNDELFEIMTLTLLKGFAVFRVKQYNDRVFLDRTRRSYWYGDRYFRLDNFYYLDTRDTCAYKMNETERKDIKYEDGFQIFDIFYQCQRYVEYCCGLDCCKYVDDNRRQHDRRPPRNPWSRDANATTPFFAFAFLSVFLFHLLK